MLFGSKLHFKIEYDANKGPVLLQKAWGKVRKEWDCFNYDTLPCFSGVRWQWFMLAIARWEAAHGVKNELSNFPLKVDYRWLSKPL